VPSEATLTVVQSTSTNGTSTIKLDNTALNQNGATEGTNYRVYTVNNVEKGTHTISKGSSEGGLFYVKVDYDKPDVEIPTHSITVNESEKGSVNVVTSAEEGANVTLTTTPVGDNKLSALTINGSAVDISQITIANKVGTYSFTMPQNDVNIVAEWTAVNQVSGTTEGELVEAKETKLYDFLASALAVEPTHEYAAFAPGKYYFDNEVYVTGNNGLLYYSNKSCKDIEGNDKDGGIRLKTNQDMVSLKLADGATVEVNVTGGSGYNISEDKARYAVVSSTADGSFTNNDINNDYILAKTGNLSAIEGTATEKLSYTNNTGDEQIVYLTATGDSFFSQIKVTVPEEVEEPTEPEATVTYVGESNANAEEDAAFAYYAEIKTNGATISGIKWIINETQEETDETPAISGNTTVYYGLVLTAPQGTTQPTVDAEALVADGDLDEGEV
jgi:hypothetical protein